MVSDQYLQVCKEEGYKFDKPVQVGDTLKIGANYFLMASGVMTEVGLKLGQTIWRKMFPGELEEAEEHLHDTVYEFLELRDWKRGVVFGEFNLSLPKIATERHERLAIINYAIALRFGGDAERSNAVIAKRDWSASSNDFRLAEAVLLDRYVEAAALMVRIGPEGEFINERAYHLWPLFRDFRDTEEFRNAYEEVYDRPFVRELKQLAEETVEDAEEAEMVLIEEEEEITNGSEEIE